MIHVVTPCRMSEYDHRMTTGSGIPELLLMENAAAAIVEEIRNTAVAAPRVLILCGGGNNGGDGVAVLRLLSQRGIAARALLLGHPDRLKNAARSNYDIAVKCGLDLIQINEESQLAREFLCFEHNIIVDALFGTGLCREVTELYAKAVELVNSSDSLTISADIPSGIDGETGAMLGCAVRADVTVTFQFAKRGHMLFPGREHTGRLVVAPIGVLCGTEAEMEPVVLESADMRAMLPRREQNSHKGSYGKGLLIAGSPGFEGAAHMACASALRCGCGLMKLAVPSGMSARFSDIPQAMVSAASASDNWDGSSPQLIEPLIIAATAIAIGPGLGKNEVITKLLRLVISSGKPAIIDADGLNMLASSKALYELLHDNIVLTPHPMEMSRICGASLTDVVNDPAGFALRTAQSMGAVILLKGATTVIAAPDGRMTFNVNGNPGLAKGGSGDVLTGVILALLCAGKSAYDAARMGAYILGASADEAMRLLNERLLTAGDVISLLTEGI